MARERGVAYDTVPPRPTAVEAIAQLDAAITTLGQVDWKSEADATVNAAAVGMQRRVNQVQAQALRPVEQMAARNSYRADGAVTASSWLRNRTNMDHGPAQRLCAAATRLRGLSGLRDAFMAGDVSLAHVTAITDAAVPTRYESIAAVQDSLVELARTANPHAVRVALRRVRDIVDPDGSQPDDDAAPCDADANDPRRGWTQWPTLDGMVRGEYLVDPVFGEMIAILMDAFSTADPADTPLGRRRSPAQQRADAMRAAIKTLLDAGLAPTIQGNKAHLLLMLDLLTVMGRDQAATFAAELRRNGKVSPQTIARLGLDAKTTVVLTMGKWRTVAVGHTHRTLPPWLRPMLEMMQRRCRDPDCDRPAAWCEAGHEIAVSEGGDTDLNETIPKCWAHHDLVTTKGWTVTMDRDTGICTWTSPDGQVIHTHPHD